MPIISTSVSSRVFYRKTGSGPVLVLLHGFPESSTLWRKVSDALAAHFTLILPDFPGSGGSELEGETSVEDMARCVKAVLDQEQIEKAVIAGHSMGGYVGFAFASLFPDSVVGLSLVHSSPLADDEERKKMRRKAIDLINKGGKTAFIAQMVPALFSEAHKLQQEDIVHEQMALAMDMPERSMVNFYNAMIGRADYSSSLTNVTHPVQWILGMEDTVISYKKILELCHKSYINFVYLYNNCGHMSMLEAPEKLIEDLKEFAAYSYNYHLRNK